MLQEVSFKKKVTASGICGTLALSLVVSSFGVAVAAPASEAGQISTFTADSSKANLVDQDFLTEKKKEQISKYVLFNGTQFVLTANTKSSLSSEDYATARSYITQTNLAISKIPQSSISSKTDESVTANFQVSVSDASIQGECINKVELFWWGAHVYLSKTTLNRAGGGLAIGGIWIPEPIVSKVLATLGVVAGLSPHGVVFDMTFFPTPQILLWTIRFQ